MNAFEQALGEVRGGRVLDAATGSGGFVYALIEGLQEFTEIIGIDTSERAIQAAQEALIQENVKFLHMDALHLEFEDGSFDTVCIANSLHHMADSRAVLAEMLRVLKPGGQILVSEMYRDGQSETQMTHVELHHWWAAVDTASGIHHDETFTRQELIDLLSESGVKNWSFIDYADLETDPHSEELAQELDKAIDRYIQRAEGLENESALKMRGEALRQRVHEVGFHSATSLLAVGQKP